MEAVRLFAKWNRVEADRSMLASLGIQELAKKQYADLSTGQKRRLHLALALISDPDIIADQKEWQKCTKAHAKLTDIVTVFREYRDLVKAKNDAEEIIAAGDDRELTEMAYDELKELKPQLAVYEERLTVFTVAI